MALKENVDYLCKELGISPVNPAGDGKYVFREASLPMFAVENISDNFVFYSPSLIAKNRYSVEWNMLLELMQQSYFWHGHTTSFTLDSNEALSAQSYINADCSRQAFFNKADQHCSFCKLVTDKFDLANKSVPEYAFITL